MSQFEKQYLCWCWCAEEYIMSCRSWQPMIQWNSSTQDMVGFEKIIFETLESSYTRPSTALRSRGREDKTVLFFTKIWLKCKHLNPACCGTAEVSCSEQGWVEPVILVSQLTEHSTLVFGPFSSKNLPWNFDNYNYNTGEIECKQRQPGNRALDVV